MGRRSRPACRQPLVRSSPAAAPTSPNSTGDIEWPVGVAVASTFRLMAMRGSRCAVMWSGGKDSALALARARAQGIQVDRLLTFYDSATARLRFHATRIEMLEVQAAAIGIQLRAVPTTWPEMEAILRSELGSLVEE